MSKNILILGSTGLLGNAVGNYFENHPDYNAMLTYRDESVSYGKDKYKFDALSVSPLFKLSNRLVSKVDYVINCIGTIKPFMDDSPIAARYLNALFPWEVSKWANNTLNAKLIHITTDCVYSGLLEDSSYLETYDHDALDAYGKSKSLGEPDDCLVLRTSIIGEEIHKNASLIEWAKSQKGKEVRGYTNHYWNGITTKQYAKICDQIIREDLWEKNLYHISSPSMVSKHEMLEMFNEKFNLNLKIEAYETEEVCNRSLGSIYDFKNQFNIPSVKDQVNAL